MTEIPYMRRLLRDAAKHAMWLFRFNVGTGWQGKRLYSWGGKPIPHTHVLLANARVFHAGPPAGFSDLAGWTEHTVTADDVGRKLAVFTAVETKTATGRPTPAQLAFVEAVRRSGGRAAVLHEGDTLAALAETGKETEA